MNCENLDGQCAKSWCNCEQVRARHARAQKAPLAPLAPGAGGLFGVPIWNPLDHGIRNAPLMVPAHEYNRVVSNLADALSLALQYVPLTGDDADKIRELERAATIPPKNGA